MSAYLPNFVGKSGGRPRQRQTSSQQISPLMVSGFAITRRPDSPHCCSQPVLTTPSRVGSGAHWLVSGSQTSPAGQPPPQGAVSTHTPCALPPVRKHERPTPQS